MIPRSNSLGVSRRVEFASSQVLHRLIVFRLEGPSFTRVIAREMPHWDSLLNIKTFRVSVKGKRFEFTRN